MAKIAPEHTPDDFDEMFDKDSVDWRDRAPGEKVSGTVVDLAEFDGEFSTYPIVTLDLGDHLVRVSCHHSVLRNEVMGRDVRIGDRLGIRYEGEKPSKRGPKPYHSYTVMHRRAQANEPGRVRSTREFDGEGREVPEPF